MITGVIATQKATLNLQTVPTTGQDLVEGFVKSEHLFRQYQRVNRKHIQS